MGCRNRYYDPDFKVEAVRLVVKEGRRVREVERSLGITYGLLKDWIKALGARDEDARSDNVAEAGKRVKELEKELARVRMERDILKKAVAVFSRDPNPYSGS